MKRFSTVNEAALRLLTDAHEGKLHLSRKAGQFCGQAVVSLEPMTPAQSEWFDQLLCKAGFEAMGI